MAKGEDKNEIIAHEWTTLETLWEGCKGNVAEPERKRIQELFPVEADRWRSGAEQWGKLNQAEQLVGMHLSGHQLAIEYDTLLALARSRGLSSIATHEANKKLFDGATDEAKPEQRAAYLALLHDLQSSFIETRFNRRLRRETAQRLFCFGLGVLGLAIAPLVVFWLVHKADILAPGGVASAHQLFSSAPVFGLATVMGFGVLGAYFSRLMAFQTKLATLSFEEVMNLYQTRVLLVRLVVGLIGALIFYYVLRAGLVAGTAFPDLSRISVGEQLVWKLGSDGIAASQNGKLVPSGLTILAPTTELAKLIVWSFLAGFSERLISDTLERTEAQSKKNEG